MSLEDFTSHHFENESGSPGGGTAFGPGFAIGWQNGPRGRKEPEEPNGAFVEDVIAAARDRLEYYQGSNYACDFNADAIKHLSLAIDALAARTRNRELRNVEGTHAA